MSTLPSYDIFFTGPSDDPRHNCVMIGFLDDTTGRPFYLAFETPEIPTSETVTTVRHISWRLYDLLTPDFRYTAIIGVQ